MKNLIIITILISLIGAGFYFNLLGNAPDQILNKRPIICFGDSITSGKRFTFKKESYPYLLGQLLGEPVINEGISGETSSQALKRIKRDVLDKNPRLVIVQFGGNDPYSNIPADITLANNEMMIEQIISSGSEAVIFIGESNMLEPKYLNGFREIAKRKNVLLIENAIDEIIKDRTLSYDGVHPNMRGYEIVTQKIYEALKPILNRI